MDIGAFLTQETITLRAAGIKTARLDVLILLEDELATDRALLLAHPEATLSAKQLHRLRTKITQRATHTPLAYVRGKAAFYGRDFVVTPDVLVPRPETETTIQYLLQAAPDLPTQPHIADIGTGTGCIGITAKLELPQSQVTLIDTDNRALTVAKKNAQQMRTHVVIRQGDLLQELPDEYDVLLANLPYVPTAHPINKAAQHEPALALFSGSDGLDAYRLFWRQVGQLRRKPIHIIVEALPEQAKSLQSLAATQNYKVAQASDFVHGFVLAA